MIGSLRGALLARTPDAELLVEVAGVGYRVQTTASTAAASEQGSEVFLHVSHVVREDSVTLYGFADLDERCTFEALLRTPGIGPTLALAILGVHTPDALRRLAAQDDIQALCLVPGIGPKTAARLLIELKSKLGQPPAGTATSNGAAPTAASGADAARADVRAALAELDYPADEITQVLASLPATDDAAALLREALRSMATSR